MCFQATTKYGDLQKFNTSTVSTDTQILPCFELSSPKQLKLSSERSISLKISTEDLVQLSVPLQTVVARNLHRSIVEIEVVSSSSNYHTNTLPYV